MYLQYGCICSTKYFVVRVLSTCCYRNLLLDNFIEELGFHDNYSRGSVFGDMPICFLSKRIQIILFRHFMIQKHRCITAVFFRQGQIHKLLHSASTRSHRISRVFFKICNTQYTIYNILQHNASLPNCQRHVQRVVPVVDTIGQIRSSDLSLV